MSILSYVLPDKGSSSYLSGEFRVAPYYEYHVVSFCWVQMNDTGMGTCIKTRHTSRRRVSGVNFETGE